MEDNIRRLFEIKRYHGKTSEFMTDIVVRESDFNIFVNEKKVITLSVLPEKLEELAYGFLYTENILYHEDEIKAVEFNFSDKYINFQMKIPLDRINAFHRNMIKSTSCCSALASSLCGCRIAFPKTELISEKLLNCLHEFEKKSALFRETGAVHSCAIIRNYQFCSFAEDIGRHNALDKVTGDCFKKHFPFNDCILFTSGRITSEIVKKCIRAGYSTIVSHSAPTSEAIRLGWDHKIYLIGFARANRFNIYSGFEQLIIK